MKIVGMCVIGPYEGKKYLSRCLAHLHHLTDSLVVALNNTDRQTERIVKEYGATWFRDNREWGKYQPKIKENLLKETAKEKPDWIISVDADEELLVTRNQLEELASTKNDVAYSFWCLDLWDSPDQYREDFLFETVRFFKYLPKFTSWAPQPLHCDNAPEVSCQWVTRSKYAFLHYGLMKKQHRQEKYERYQRYDPTGIYLPRFWYEALLQESPPLAQISDFAKLNLETHFRTKLPKPFMIKTNSKEKKSYRLLNKGNVQVTLELTEADLEIYLKYKHFRLLGETGAQEKKIMEVPVEADPLECEICGYTAKSERGLKIHTTRRHG